MADETTKTPPPNPHYKRYYRASCDIGGAMEIEIPAPGGKLPTGEDANDLIYVLQMIIRQLERSRDAASAPKKSE